MTNMPIVQFLVNFRDESAPPNLSLANATELGGVDGRVVSSINTSRGRSTELATVQTGTLAATVLDPLETLNPANPASPLQQPPNRLVPYRGLGVRAWWPLTGNMINEGTYGSVVQAGSDDNPATNLWSTDPTEAGLVDIVDDAGNDVIRIQADGPTAAALPMTAGLDALSAHYWTIPGQVHTYTVWVRIDEASTGTEAWLEIDGNTSATATATATYTQLTITWTAALNRTPIVLWIDGGPTGTLTQTVYLTDEQLELGATPTAYTATGPVRYRRWTGYVERWPLAWEDRGFTGTRPLEAVDALAVLARTEIRQNYRDMVLADGATLYLPLDETGPPGLAEGDLGPRVLMREDPAPRGSTVQWGGATLPDGSKAVQVGQLLQNPADVPYAEQESSLDSAPPGVSTPSTIFGLDTRGATIEGWVRISSGAARMQFRAMRGDVADCFMGVSDVLLSSHQVLYSHTADNAYLGTPTSALHGLASLLWPNEWRYWALTFDPDPGDPTKYRLRWRIDTLTRTVPAVAAHRVIPVNSIIVHAHTKEGDPAAQMAAARMAFYPRALSDAETLRHYQRGIGYDGETAQARAARLLEEWWRGPFTALPGASRPMGPDHGYDGGTALAALEDVTLADDGMCLAREDGTVTVESSLTRPSSPSVVAVFGEDTDAGEIPYEGVEFDFDPGDLYSRISVTRQGRSSPLVLIDEQVEALIGPRTLSRTVNVADDYELGQVALTYQTRYGQARLRVKKITFHPHANPDLWPTLLTLSVSDRVRVRRRTAAGVVMSADYFIESVRDDIDKEASTWPITFELSPAPVEQAWILGDAERGVLGSTTAPAH